MNKRTLLIGASALLIGASALFPVTAAAYQGDPNVQGPNYSAERHTAMQKAFDSKDYDAWKALVNGRGRMSQVITKENFSKFAEAHELAEQGKTAEAAAIRAELGLGNGSGTCGQTGTQTGGRGMMNR